MAKLRKCSVTWTIWPAVPRCLAKPLLISIQDKAGLMNHAATSLGTGRRRACGNRDTATQKRGNIGGRCRSNRRRPSAITSCGGRVLAAARSSVESWAFVPHIVRRQGWRYVTLLPSPSPLSVAVRRALVRPEAVQRPPLPSLLPALALAAPLLSAAAEPIPARQHASPTAPLPLSLVPP